MLEFGVTIRLRVAVAKGHRTPEIDPFEIPKGIRRLRDEMSG